MSADYFDLAVKQLRAAADAYIDNRMAQHRLAEAQIPRCFLCGARVSKMNIAPGGTEEWQCCQGHQHFVRMERT